MCGLNGVLSNNIYQKEEKAFEDLLTIGSLRGIHSCGVFILSRNDEEHIIKTTNLPPHLLDHKKYKQAVLKQNVLMIGHNRYGTKGAFNHKNAHPFTKNHIVGTHNGTVFAHNMEDHNKFETDSEAILHDISINGVKETWGKLLGSAALVWWDKNERTLNMLRNSRRSLFFTITKDKKAMFWASEAWMLQGCTSRRGIELDTVWVPKEDILYSFRINADDSVHYDATRLEPKKYGGIITQGAGNPFGNIYEFRNGHWFSSAKEQEHTKKTNKEKRTSKNEVKRRRKKIREALRKLGKEEFLKQYGHCVCCGSNLREADLSFPNTLDWKLYKDFSLCGPCQRVADSSEIDVEDLLWH